MKLHLSDNIFIETSKAIDLSIPVNPKGSITAWHLQQASYKIVESGGFIGSVQDGGNVNFRDLYFNPHSHCTHTECCGHITKEVSSINQQKPSFFCKALLITIKPRVENNNSRQRDSVIDISHFNEYKNIIDGHEAIIIRTLPNTDEKLNLDYSGTNPCYLSTDIIPLLNKHSIKHLIIDLPSVDKENDNGRLAFHHQFWNVPQKPIMDRTITELAYIPNDVEDGSYILNLQVSAFENDASPSRPIIFKIRRAV